MIAGVSGWCKVRVVAACARAATVVFWAIHDDLIFHAHGIILRKTNI